MQTSVCAGRALRVGPSANPGPAARAALHWQWQLTANFQRGCVAAAPCSRLLMRSGLGGLTCATAGVVGMAAGGHAGRRVLLPLQIPWQPLPPGKHEALLVLHHGSAPFQTPAQPSDPVAAQTVDALKNSLRQLKMLQQKFVESKRALEVGFVGVGMPSAADLATVGNHAAARVHHPMSLTQPMNLLSPSQQQTT